MSQKSLNILIIIGMTFLLLVSCTPAQAIPTQQQPASTSNPGVFSTMVASTAAAMMTQTMQAMPSPTATMSAPTESLPPTVTATPTDASEKTSLSEMEDESIQFFDYQAGITLTFPTGWKAARLSEQEFADMQQEAEESDPVLQHSMESVKDLDPIIYRVHAFNTQDDYVYEGEGSLMDVLFIEGDTQELELIAEAEVQPKELDGYQLIAPKYQIRTDSLELFTLEESWSVTSSTEQQVTIFHKRVVFKVSSGTTYIDLYVPSEIKDDVLAEFNDMVEKMSIFVP